MDTTELPFKVEAWSKKGQSIDRLIATATNVLVARACAPADSGESPAALIGAHFCRRMAPPTGFEPVTHSLEDCVPIIPPVSVLFRYMLKTSTNRRFRAI